MEENNDFHPLPNIADCIEGSKNPIKPTRQWKPSGGWGGGIIKRRLEPGHPLFHEGDVYCHLMSKYVTVDVPQDNSDQTR